MMKPWRTLSRKIVYSRAPYLEVAIESVELPDGRIVSDYHQVSAGAFATVIAETDDGRFVVLRQYRHGVRRVGLALPGGRIDAGESPLDAAQRELLEETGFVAGSWEAMRSWDASCTYGFAKNHYFRARAARQMTAATSNDLEETELVLLTREEARQALFVGEFVSIGHVAPLALALLAESSLRSSDDRTS